MQQASESHPEQSDTSAAFARDSSARKQLEDALVKRTREFQTLADNIPDLITRYDKNLRYLYVNPAFERRVGVSRSALLHKTPSEACLHERICAFVETHVAEVLRTGSRNTVEYFTSLNEWERGYFQAIIVPECDEQGIIDSVLVVTRDVTASRELKERQDTFIALASHELRTPLTILMMSTEVLAQMLAGQQENRGVAAVLQKMEDQLDQMTSLVNELLDVSKIQAGRFEYTMEALALDDLVRETVDLLQPGLRQHTIYVIGASGATISGDKKHLSQVLTNLLTNAVKYSPQGQRVDVSLAAVDGYAVVQVHDDGIGIPVAHQKDIFDRFYRVRDENTSFFPGLGIGLYVCAEIVKHHSGTITVESEEGKGATFTVALPWKQ